MPNFNSNNSNDGERKGYRTTANEHEATTFTVVVPERNHFESVSTGNPLSAALDNMKTENPFHGAQPYFAAAMPMYDMDGTGNDPKRPNVYYMSQFAESLKPFVRHVNSFNTGGTPMNAFMNFLEHGSKNNLNLEIPDELRWSPTPSNSSSGNTSQTREDGDNSDKP